MSNHVAAMAPAAVIGTVCGLLAIAFTAVNLKAARLRDAVLTKNQKLRMAEPLVIIAVFVTLGMLLPLAFPCTPTSCVMREGESEPFCPPGVTSHVKYVIRQTQLSFQFLLQNHFVHGVLIAMQTNAYSC